ncbi:antirestriction protein ArdA [Listeria innocua]|nr:antirestriction protein ArdA [Listeria innocua]
MDDTIQVYVTNLSRFEDDGLIIAAWFTLPVSLDELREKLQLETDESYEIEDWEAPFRLTDDRDILTLNRLALLIEENSHYDLFPYLDELIDLDVFESHEDGLKRLNQFTHFEEKPTDPDFLEDTFELSDGTYFTI